MLHRSRSRDSGAGDATPRASYFSKQQTADYLSDLRNNRPARPVGSRPPPNASPARKSMSRDDSYRPRNSTSSRSSYELNQSRSSSVLSYYQGAGSISSGRSSPEKMFYAAARRDMEQRESEKQEATAMRTVLAQGSPERGHDQALHSAAQQEAAELIWKHQNPHTPYRVHPTREKVLEQQNHIPSADYEYPIDPADYEDPTSRHDATPQPTRQTQPSPERSPSRRLSNRFSMSRMSNKRRSITSLRNVSGTIKKAVFPNAREHIYEDKQSPTKVSPRKPSGEKDVPIHVRRNPFARAQAARQNQQAGLERDDVIRSMKTLNTASDRQRRNPDYTTNDSPMMASADQTPTEQDPDRIDQAIRYKDGLEVRSDDIRAATSMRRQDKSPRLPSPTVVSDNPNCPIVSFENSWQPREAPNAEESSLARSILANDPLRSNSSSELSHVDRRRHASRSRSRSPAEGVQMHRGPRSEQVMPRATPTDTAPHSGRYDRNEHQRQAATDALRGPARSSTLPSSNEDRAATRRGPERQIRERASPFKATPARSQTMPSPGARVPSPGATAVPKRPVPDRTLPRQDSPPSIHITDDSRKQSPQNTHDGPSIQVSGPEEAQSRQTRRNANMPQAPTISVSDPAHTDKSGQRPFVKHRGARRNPTDLPQPRPEIQHSESAPAAMSRGHWTPTARSNGALCAQCALPISGRIVTAAGTRFHPECFICYHCGEALECVAFYPEPSQTRQERLERIESRLAGHEVEAPAGVAFEEDNDDALRFYCHLDYHEFFSPRCKHCQTPIEGEVIVACGAEWHPGHFFCAECGDPFSPQIPFVEKDGYAWCVNCHQNRSSTRCKKCKKPVTDMVLKALGADWHDGCFRCFECNSTFADGKFFLRGKSQDPVCSGCEARRLKG